MIDEASIAVEARWLLEYREARCTHRGCGGTVLYSVPRGTTDPTDADATQLGEFARRVTRRMRSVTRR